MANLNYIFNQLYGFEPFQNNGPFGGALVTGQNLVITSWLVADKGDDPPAPFITIGDPLLPVSQNDNIGDQRKAANTQSMHSRVSCMAQVIPQPKKSVADTILLVLNPPNEVKQQLAQAVVFNGGDPTDLSNYTVKKSLNANYPWHGLGAENDGLPQLAFWTELLLSWGTYLPLGDYDGVDFIPVPLLATNGANGQKPVFFDTFTTQGVQDMIAAVNAGNFFIPMMVTADFNDGLMFSIEWPHSGARGA
jgi:hypothetical protein